MPESTLALTFSDLQREYGAFMGWGHDFEWETDADKTSCVSADVKSGCRRFYFPKPLEGEREAYEWSFLRPLGTVALATGESVVDLPDEFGGIEGQVTVSSTGSNSFFPIQITGEGVLRAAFAELPSATGRPLKAALLFPKTNNANAGQRFQLQVFPAADADYTLTFQYYVLPEALTLVKPYMLGGAQHAETLLEAVLSVAEERRDDAKGVHYIAFMERLAASISQDRRMKPQNLGYNRDRSDGEEWNRRFGYYQSQVTFDGVQY